MQIVQKTLIASAVAGIVSLGLSSGAAYAKPPKKGAQGGDQAQQAREAKRAEFKAACKQDAQDLCAGVQGGKGEVLKCLADHEEELSDACAEKISRIKAWHAEREKVKAACAPDVQRLCGDVAPGEGAIRQCMKAKRDQVSQACKDAWKAAHGAGKGA
jgi:flagellar motility protein MotE (MotC chaperone)